jgi:hypothetical protein
MDFWYKTTNFICVLLAPSGYRLRQWEWSAGHRAAIQRIRVDRTHGSSTGLMEEKWRVGLKGDRRRSSIGAPQHASSRFPAS